MPEGNYNLMKFVHFLLSCVSSIAMTTVKTVFPKTATTAKTANTYTQEQVMAWDRVRL